MSIPFELVLLYDTAPVEDHWKGRRPDFRNLSEDELVDFARGGERDAFAELVRRHRNTVYNTAWQYLRDREEAWDLSQEAFVKADRSIKRFRGDSSFKTWMVRITANLCKDYFKKRRLKTVPLDELAANRASSDDVQNPDRQMEAQELGAAIETALKQLSFKHYQVFVLRERQGLAYQEIAETVGCSVGTVMSRLHHARKKLQVSLIAMGYGEAS